MTDPNRTQTSQFLGWQFVSRDGVIIVSKNLVGAVVAFPDGGGSIASQILYALVSDIRAAWPSSTDELPRLPPLPLGTAFTAEDLIAYGRQTRASTIAWKDALVDVATRPAEVGVAQASKVEVELRVRAAVLEGRLAYVHQAVAIIEAHFDHDNVEGAKAHFEALVANLRDG
jgi:hypothetical protein